MPPIAQNKPQAVNPKVTLARKLFAKMRPALIRGVGTLGRVQVNPAAAEAEAHKLVAQLTDNITYILAATKLPVVEHTEPLPATGWVYTALSGQRNAKHGGLTCGPVLGYVQEKKLGLVGLLMTGAEDCVVAAAGEGANGPDGRLRVSGRDLPDSIIMLPMSSIDTETLSLMSHADTLPFNTRKTGNPMADALRVAAGQADGLIATRLTPFEKMAIDLLIKEAGGTTRTLTTPAGEVLIGGTLKVVAALAGLLDKA